MRLSRFLVGACCTVLLSVLTVPAASATTSSSSTLAVRYVALGDSYSSGVGAGSYDSGSGSCQRSNNAYAKLWANAHSPASFKFAACSGARTADVLNNQVPSLASDTTLVSITIGGNDAGFASVMQTCVLGSTSDCTSAVSRAEAFMDSTLPGRLRNTYAAIKSRSPSARVVVLSYPRLYKITSFCVGLNNTKRTALNRAADHLASTTSQAASASGVGYSDVRDEFAGHELCSGDDWLNSVSIPISDSYHPTATGQRLGYLPAFTSAA